VKNNNPSRRLGTPVPERLREARMARGITISEMAEAIGVTRQAVSQYELGHVPPSGAVFAKIIDVLGMPLAYFLEPVEIKHVPTGVTFFRSLASATKKSREAITVRSKWIEKIYLYLQEYINFPKVNVPNYSAGNDLDDEDIEDIAIAVRKKWGLGLGPISNVTLLLEKQGIIIARDEFGYSKTDACSQWRGERPFIFLGSDKESAVRSRFDACHELGHLVLHMWVDDVQFSDKRVQKRLENEANKFAAAFLLPRETFCQEIMSTSINHFKMLKRRWKVSIAAMVYRCHELGILSDSQVLYLRKQLSKYRRREPLDDELTPENPNVLKQAITMLIEAGVKTPAEIVDELKLRPDFIESICNLPAGTLTLDGKVIPINLKSIKERGLDNE
jgi:Zn-dependent peptidase ImmA (M78 family)/transcriptional regulator with XRE-family HTH domain